MSVYQAALPGGEAQPTRVVAEVVIEKRWRLVVGGTREWSDPRPIRWALATVPKSTIVKHGACRGVDQIAGEVARELGLEVEAFPAEWDDPTLPDRRAAGPIRNGLMLDSGVDAVWAFHPYIRGSRGTRDLMLQAWARKIPVRLWTLVRGEPTAVRDPDWWEPYPGLVGIKVCER